MKIEWEKDKKAKLLHRIMKKRQAIQGENCMGKWRAESA